jgi:hypothetical protein
MPFAMNPQPQYHPIENLWLISQVIKGSVQQARDLTKVLKEAEHQPYVLDDSLVNRAIKQYQEGLEFVPIYREQLRRWQELKLTDSQAPLVAELQKDVETMQVLYTDGLAMAKKMAEFTIDKVMGMSDLEVALKSLSMKGFKF